MKPGPSPSPVVKICGLTRWEDAFAAYAAGADLLGFVFVRASPRYIPPDEARRIISLLPSHVPAVGVFARESEQEMDRVAALCGLSFLQLHGGREDSGRGLATPVIRVIRVGGAGDLEGIERLPPGLLLLDARAEEALGGTGRTFDWDLARAICARRPVIVAGGLDPGNVGRAVELLRPWGVDVSSGVEASPGVKDHQKVEEFIRAARAAAIPWKERKDEGCQG